MRFQLASSPPNATEPGFDWRPAVVPGGVHESLVASGELQHPFAEGGEAACAWIEGRAWWYRARVPHAGVFVADVDTVCDVWLDGEHLARHESQHRPLTLEVRAGELLLRFLPPLTGLVPDGQREEVLEPLRRRMRVVRPNTPLPSDDEVLLPALRTRRRKAAFAWGWDFAPRVPSLGILRFELRSPSSTPCLAGVYARAVEVDAAMRTATLAVDVDVTGVFDRCRVSAAGYTAEGADTGVVLELANVDAWWTHDLGAQPLYDVTVELLVADRVVDTRTIRTGLRVVELIQEADREGTTFGFRLNGTPIFARGANWVPASMLVGSVTWHRDLVDLAREGAMNMLRVWGGGIYEPDDFYDACDEAGILIWQDFMFAGFDYPSQEDALTDEISAEAAFQVRRLRNHPCIALWCGNNEVQLIHQMVTGDLPRDPWFDELLPGVVAEHAPGAAYWPGSPWGSGNVNGVHDGDRHAWEVWHGLDLGAGGPDDYTSRGAAMHWRRFADDTGRFISEFGIIAPPELGTLERWGSVDLLHRTKDTPSDKAELLMAEETGVPENRHFWLEALMACQAEGLKAGVEHYRRRQPACQGALVWQLNDPWPGLSWSVIDHDLVPKPAYWYLKRAFHPSIATLRVHEGLLEVWLTTSLASPMTTTLRLQGMEIEAAVEAYGSACVWSGAAPDVDVLWLSGDGVPDNRLILKPLKDLKTGRVSASVRRSAGEAVIELAAHGDCFMVRVLAPHAGVRFDTNSLDLRDGSTARITMTGLRDGAEVRVASYGREPRRV